MKSLVVVLTVAFAIGLIGQARAGQKHEEHPSDTTATKKADTSSPTDKSSPPKKGSTTPNPHRFDPYKNFKFR